MKLEYNIDSCLVATGDLHSHQVSLSWLNISTTELTGVVWRE